MEQQLSGEKDAKLKLIIAATQLFAQKGFAAVSIRELAEGANVNSALISYHFGGKENLYAAVLEEQFALVREKLALVLDSNLPPLERLQRYALGIAAAHHDCPYLVRFMYSELATPTNCFDTIVKKFIATLFAKLRSTIEEGIAAGNIKPDVDAGHAALSLAAIINFYFIAKPITAGFLPPSDDSDDKYVLRALDIYLNGVKEHD